jgi:hypothetical protein
MIKRKVDRFWNKEKENVKETLTVENSEAESYIKKKRANSYTKLKKT